MSCPSFDELSAYADGEIDAGECARFRRHIGACPLCQAELGSLRAMGRELRALPAPTLGFDLAAQMDDRLRPVPPPRRPATWPSWRPAGLTLAALAVGVWLGGSLAGGAVAAAPPLRVVRAFDPVPPGGLCAAAELCRPLKGMQ